MGRAHINGALTFFGPQEGFTPGHQLQQVLAGPRGRVSSGEPPRRAGAAGAEGRFPGIFQTRLKRLPPHPSASRPPHPTPRQPPAFQPFLVRSQRALLCPSPGFCFPFSPKQASEAPRVAGLAVGAWG